MEITRLSPQEACRLLGCGYDWLMAMTRKGEIPFFSIGRRKFFTRQALTKWIQDQEKRSTQSGV